MNKTTSIKKLEQEAMLLGYRIIIGKGNFQSNICLVKDKKIIVINKLLDEKTKVDAITDLLVKIRSGQPIFSDE